MSQSHIRWAHPHVEFYNGISPTIHSFVDLTVDETFMSRNVEDAKTIVERMAAGSSPCGELDPKPRKQPEDMVEENCRLNQQIKKLKKV